jgi:phage I-like protein
MESQIAVLTETLSAPSTRFRIIPDGTFRSWDGRPNGLPGWYMDGQIAGKMISAAVAKRDDFVIDYEHASLKASEAPAAGWFSRLSWQVGQGLFVEDARWTDRAKAMLRAGEYRYVSPVFRFNGKTGEVESLVNLALTNTPALEGLTDLSTLAINAARLGGGEAPYSDLSKDDLAELRGIEVYNHTFGALGLSHPRTEWAAAKLKMEPGQYIAACRRGGCGR